MTENNSLNEWSDGEDDWIFGIKENNTVCEGDSWEWSDPEADDIIRNMVVDDSERSNDQQDNMEVDDTEWSDPETDIQTGRGKKRKSDEPLLPEKDFYEIESVTKHHSKKFGMTATDHIIRFNTVLSELDLPISIPFMPLAQLTTERVFSQIERIIQSNQDFRLNDTVTVDIIRVEEPQGGASNGRSKRTILNIREYLKKKKSVITITNTDNLCLGRALAVAIARIENDPKYHQIRESKGRIQPWI